MDSCFQFVARDEEEGFDLRIKYYCKSLQKMQSAGVTKTLGMNMKAIFCPTVRMGRAFHEARDVGLSRIEITYTAKTCKAMQSFFNAGFSEMAQRHMDLAFGALNKLDGLCWHLP